MTQSIDTTQTYKYVDIREGPCNNYTNKEFFPGRSYDWDDFQKHAFNAIDEGNNVLVCAPTASGKTTVAEYAIMKHLTEKNKVIFTSPIKSLSLEKLSEFKVLCKDLQIDPGILTGDNKENLDSPIIIATAEIVRNSLYRLKEESNNPDNVLNNDLISQITCVVIDEAHFINLEKRGTVWEETLALLDNNVQIVMLSATIDTPEDFAEWVGKIKHKKITVVKKLIRPVPLAYYIFDGVKNNMICDEHGNYMEANFKQADGKYTQLYGKLKQHEICNSLLNDSIKYCRDNNLLQTLVFIFSIAKCEQYAQSTHVRLLDHVESAAAQQEFVVRMKSVEKIYKNLPLYDNIKALIGKGLCYHHSELPAIFKEVIQELFRDGYIKLLYATETFAVGVNMPVRTIILGSIMKYSDNGLRTLQPDEFKQICGRAGRRGKDVFGTAILLPLYGFYSSLDIRNLIFGKMPTIISKMEIDYNMFLKLKQSRIADNSSFFSKTLKRAQNMKGIERIEREINQLNAKLKEFSFDSQSEEVIKMEEYLKLQRIAEGKETIGGFALKMSNKDKKKFKTLQSFKDKNSTLFSQYKDYHSLTGEISKLQNEIMMLSGGITEDRLNKLGEFLKEFNYLDENGNLTPKGVIASQVNECDASPLLVYIFESILDDENLTSQEIVAILSILLDKSRSEREYGLVLGKELSSTDISVLKHMGEYNEKGTVDCTFGIRKTINNVIDFTERARGLEAKLQIYNSADLWDISLGYVEVSYKWASGESIESMFTILDSNGEGLGTFIKNMLKICNILNDLKCIASNTGKLEIIEVLDTAKESIQRDVVNNFSIHLIE